jgi:PIN domain nuclease of toxin-antitoxin system
MYLLDTHVFLLALANPKRLSINARTILSRAEIDIYVSIATMWELATLQQTNKIVSNADFISEADRVGFHMLDIASSHLEIFKNLPAMSDPIFDPMLIAQAKAEEYIFVTENSQFQDYGIEVLLA